MTCQDNNVVNFNKKSLENKKTAKELLKIIASEDYDCNHFGCINNYERALLYHLVEENYNPDSGYIEFVPGILSKEFSESIKEEISTKEIWNMFMSFFQFWCPYEDQWDVDKVKSPRGTHKINRYRIPFFIENISESIRKKEYEDEMHKLHEKYYGENNDN